MKRILLVHNYYQFPGGEDTVVENEIALLREHGNIVSLYSRNNTEIKDMGLWGKVLLPFLSVFNIRTYIEIKKIIHDEKIDIVHVHNTLSLISPAVYYAALSLKVPVFQTIHNFRLICPGATLYRDGGICEDCIHNGMYCSIKNKCYRKSKLQTLCVVLGLCFHRLTKIYKKVTYISLTDFNKGKIQSDKYFRDATIKIKPNFVFDFGGRQVLDEQSETAEEYYVFVGRLEEIKGIDVIYDAFKGMPQKKLKIVGCGDLEQHIRQRIDDDGVTNIEMLGYKQRPDVNSIVKGAKALIMCSQWYETFGMVVVESYSNGTPVIAGNIGNIKDIVVDNVTGKLFTYNDSDALAKALAEFELLEADKISDNCYRYYREKFTSDVNYDMLMKIYDGN